MSYHQGVELDVSKISEKDFQRVVVDFAQMAGWEVFHISDSRKSANGKWVGDSMAAGLPDLILVHPTRGFIFAELKREKGKLRPKQRDCLDAMAAATINTRNVFVHLWRPSDMDETVVPLLRSGKGETTHGF